jgi:hypothetical protein
MDFFERYEKSLIAYNRASGLMDKGGLEEAEGLLREALSMYPREFLMDGGAAIDPHIRDSYDTLFTNIRIKLETLESLAGGGQRLDTRSITSLQELVLKNLSRIRSDSESPDATQGRQTPERHSEPATAEFEPYFEESGPEYLPEAEKIEVPYKKEPEKIQIEPEPTHIAEEGPEAIAAESTETPLKSDFQRDFRGVSYESGQEEPCPPAAPGPVADSQLEEALESALGIEDVPDAPAVAEPPPVLERSIDESLRQSPSKPYDETQEMPAREHADETPEWQPEAEQAEVSSRPDIEDFLQEIKPSKPVEVEVITAERVPEAPENEPEAGGQASQDSPESFSYDSIAEEPAPPETVRETQPNEGFEGAAETTAEEDQPIEMPIKINAEKTGLLDSLGKKTGAFFSRFKKGKREELPTINVHTPALETIEEEAIAAPEPATPAEEPAQVSVEPEAAAHAGEDDEEEALLSHEEFEKQKLPKIKKPISMQTKINASAIFSALLVAILFLAGVALMGNQFISSQKMPRAYKQGAALALKGKIGLDGAFNQAAAYRALSGNNDVAQKTLSYIVADWGKQLRTEGKNPEGDVFLLSLFKKQGIRSASLDGEILTALIEQCAADIKAGRTENANEFFTRAVQIAGEGNIPETVAFVYRKQLARLGYLLNAQAAIESLARKDSDKAFAAAKGLISLDMYLAETERKEISNMAQRTAERLAEDGQAALNKGDTVLAGKRAQQALELNPNSRTALALQKRAAGR